jgi:hypothetical protein
MESLEREQPHGHHRRRQRRRNQTGALGLSAGSRRFLVAVVVMGNHAAYAREGNGDRSSSSSTSFGGMPSRNSNSLKKNSGTSRSSIKPTDRGAGTGKDKDSRSSKSKQQESSDISSSILSSPFLDSFQEQVHEIVSDYRSEVRNTFQELAHDMLHNQERKLRQQRQLQEQKERREAKAGVSASADKETEQDEKAKQVVVDDGDDEQGVGGDNGNVNADWDDEMDASLFAPETVDSEQPFEQERFDMFSDLAGDGTDHEADNNLVVGGTDEMGAPLFAPETTDSEPPFEQERLDVFSDLVGDDTSDEADNNFVVGDTDEEDGAVLGRLLEQSGLPQETSLSRPDGNDVEAMETLDSELVHSRVQTTSKKKKKKKKKPKKGQQVADILEASDSNEDKLPVKVPSSGVSDLLASPVDKIMVAKVLRSMTSAIFFAIMYVLTVMLIKALSNVMKQ